MVTCKIVGSFSEAELVNLILQSLLSTRGTGCHQFSHRTWRLPTCQREKAEERSPGLNSSRR